MGKLCNGFNRFGQVFFFCDLVFWPETVKEMSKVPKEDISCTFPVNTIISSNNRTMICSPEANKQRLGSMTLCQTAATPQPLVSADANNEAAAASRP